MLSVPASSGADDCGEPVVRTSTGITSVSALVALELDRLVDHDERYEAASRRARALLARASDRGGRTWERDELHGR